MPKFDAPWLVPGSYAEAETLQNFMAMVEPGAFAGMSPEQIRKALIEELRFVSPYDEQEKKEVEEYIRQQEKRAREVMTHVASQLQRLGKDLLQTVAEKMAQLTEASPLEEDLENNAEALAVLTAARMVSHREVTEVVGFLVSLMQEVNQEQADKIASIVSHLLPLNYAPDTALQLFKAISEKGDTRDVDVLPLMAGTACPTWPSRRHVGRSVRAAYRYDFHPGIGPVPLVSAVRVPYEQSQAVAGNASLIPAYVLPRSVARVRIEISCISFLHGAHIEVWHYHKDCET
ncbi:MAG: hypothetical protein FJ147_24040 [Deltaproteobacteria bacterium]|nr:hypothetical protein [Deltaproteobacteria bacterium]